jgi:hypothetical protein
MATARYESAAEKQRAYRERQRAKLDAATAQTDRAALAEMLLSVIEERAVTLRSYIEAKVQRNNAPAIFELTREYCTWSVRHERGIMNNLILLYWVQTGYVVITKNDSLSKIYEVNK